MRFGVVEGYVTAYDAEHAIADLTITLEDRSRVEIVRQERLPVPRQVSNDLGWLVDQWTQETIGNELAEQGWEVIGGGDRPESSGPLPIRSARYAVRWLSGRWE